MLVREATHRVKNYLAVVQSLIRVSAGRHDHTREFAESIAGRVEALARAQSLLTRHEWDGAELHDLSGDELRSFAADDQVSLPGPAVTI